MRLVLIVVAVLGIGALSGCALVQAVRNETVSGFCGAEPRDSPRWARIAPPPDADAYRALTRREPASERVTGDEYWFALPTGELKYCITALRRANTIPERGDGCDDRIAIWWVFRQTAAGPATEGAEYRVCVL
ncbi:MAG: hypothetical protein AB7Q23_13795 [Hyphomonadaceae bacterium]